MNKRILFQCVLTVAVLTTLNSSEGSSARERALARIAAHGGGQSSAVEEAAKRGIAASDVQSSLKITPQQHAHHLLVGKQGDQAIARFQGSGLALTHAMEHVIDPMVVAHDPTAQIWAQIQKLMSSKHTPEQKSHFYGELADYIINKVHTAGQPINRSWAEAQTYGIPAGAFLAGVHALFAAGQHPHLAPAPANLMAAIAAYGLTGDDLLAWIHHEIQNHGGDHRRVGSEMQAYDIPVNLFLQTLNYELSGAPALITSRAAVATLLQVNLVQDAEQFGYHLFDIALGIIEWQTTRHVDNVWAYLHAANVDPDTFVQALAEYHHDNGRNLDNVYQDVAACAHAHAGTISLANMMNVGVAKWDHDGRQGSILAHATHHGMTEVQFLTALYEAQHIAHVHISYVKGTLAETAKHLGIDLNAFVHLVETIGAAHRYNALPHGAGPAYGNLGSALVDYGVPHGNAAANKAYVEAVIYSGIAANQVYANCVTNGGAMSEEEFVNAVEAISGSNTLHAEAVTRFGMTDAEFLAVMTIKHPNQAHPKATGGHNVGHGMPVDDAMAHYMAAGVGREWHEAHAHNMPLAEFVDEVNRGYIRGHGTLGAALVAYGVPHGNLQEHEEFIKLVAAHVPVNQVYANVVTSGAMNEQEFVAAVQAMHHGQQLHQTYAELHNYGMTPDQFFNAIHAKHRAAGTLDQVCPEALHLGMGLNDFVTEVQNLNAHGFGSAYPDLGRALVAYGVPHGNPAEQKAYVEAVIHSGIAANQVYANCVTNGGAMNEEGFVHAVEAISGSDTLHAEAVTRFGMTDAEFLAVMTIKHPDQAHPKATGGPNVGHGMPVADAMAHYMAAGAGHEWHEANAHNMPLAEFVGEVNRGYIRGHVTLGAALVAYGVTQANGIRPEIYIQALADAHVPDNEIYINSVPAFMTGADFITVLENLYQGTAWKHAYDYGISGYEFVQALIAKWRGNENMVWPSAEHLGMTGEGFVASVFVLINEDRKARKSRIIGLGSNNEIDPELQKYGMRGNIHNILTDIKNKTTNKHAEQVFGIAEGLTPVNRRDAAGNRLTRGSALSVSLPNLAAIIGPKQNIPAPVNLVLS